MMIHDDMYKKAALPCIWHCRFFWPDHVFEGPFRQRRRLLGPLPVYEWSCCLKHRYLKGPLLGNWTWICGDEDYGIGAKSGRPAPELVLCDMQRVQAKAEHSCASLQVAMVVQITFRMRHQTAEPPGCPAQLRTGYAHLSHATLSVLAERDPARAGSLETSQILTQCY